MDESRTQGHGRAVRGAERHSDSEPAAASGELRAGAGSGRALRSVHGGKSDGLAFRQRPDGNGIDVRCHTGGCSLGVVITELEVLIGLPIWTAYVPVRDAAVKGP